MASSIDLAAVGVSFWYGSSPVVRDVNLAASAGSSLALTGPNGSGKTTLLRLLSGSIRPASGDVSLLGRPLSAWRRRERARAIAVVSQHVDPALDLSVETVIALGRTPYTGLFGQLSPSDRHAIDSAIDATDTASLSHRRFSELSGGEQQRVMLASAIAQEPRFMVLDEPTVHLDLEHQHSLLELLSRLKRERGIGILSVMHDLNLAALYFERIAVMSQGRMAIDDTADAVLRRPDVQELFRAPLSLVTHPDAGVPQLLLRPGP